MFEPISQWFWNEKFWLPPNIRWADLNNAKSSIRIPETHDLYVVFPLTLLIICIRRVFERFIALPLLLKFGLKDRSGVKVKSNPMLEKVYKDLTGTLQQQQVKTLASKLGWTVKNVEKWFHYRSNVSKPSRLTKAKESSWRFFFYFSICILGTIVLAKEDYLFDSRHFWIGYPNHDLQDGVYYYYVIELSFYSALLISQFTDVKRKDFWIQTIHHLVTISLLVFSYSCNFVRVGAVILLVHDTTDILLECGKVSKYLSSVMDIQRFCDLIFGMFAIVFFISRIVILPFWIIRSAYFEAATIFKETWPMYYCFNALLLALQTMHLYWGYLVARMAYVFFVEGQVENDARSDSEESSTNEENNSVLENSFTEKREILNGKKKVH
ncbi:ceramide synthase 6-like [Xenia sp. Carnegie-2017]|uniref:ceramide synthase 6-like n=1 Tax=Xenia sp. Carnegie-2017 TaxID=2897299 RepID=UPI001F03853B|nr:ceramide synthase 6-like [Xenia sp. Carnegie-2017]